MYIMKDKRKCDVGIGCHITLSDQQYRLLPENLKHYYKKVEEDSEDEERLSYPESSTNQSTF